MKNVHIETHEIWIQDVVDEKMIELHKIKIKFNPADSFTKYLSREVVDLIVDRLDHAHEQGSNEVAPELTNRDDGQPMLFPLLEHMRI